MGSERKIWINQLRDFGERAISTIFDGEKESYSEDFAGISVKVQAIFEPDDFSGAESELLKINVGDRSRTCDYSRQELKYALANIA